MADPDTTRLSRRRVLRLFGAAGTLPLAASLLSGCASPPAAAPAVPPPPSPAPAPAPASAASPAAAPSAASSAASSPAAARPAAAASTVDQVTVVVEADVSTLDPHNEPTTNFSHLRQTFENLIRIDENLKIQPALATSWKMLDDTTWEFKIREGVKFHNGDTLTADDIEWCLTRIMAAGAGSGPRKAYVAWFDSAKATDRSTLQIRTKGPYPAVLSDSYIPIIIPKAYFERVGPEGFNKAPVGTGPYKIDNWALNQKLELSAYADYWGGAPTVQRAAFRVIPEEATRVSEIQTGGADVLLNLSPTRVAELRSNSRVKLVSKASVLNFYLGINTHERPFDDLRVRQAIAYAIDVPTMIQELLSGYGTHSNSLVHSTSFGWNQNLTPFKYDPARAKQLLAETGYPNGFETTLLGGPGVWPVTKESGEAISGFLAAVGIKAPMNLLEWGDYFDRYRATKLGGLFLWGNSSPGLDAAAHLNLNFRCPPTGRGLYWCSAEADDLIDAAQKDLKPDSRAKTYARVQEIMHDQVVAVPLWQYQEVDAISSRINWDARGDYYVQLAEIKAAQ